MTNGDLDKADVQLDASQLLDQVVVDVVSRLEAGQAVDLESLATDHPELQDRLEKLLPTLTAMVDLGRAASGDSKETYPSAIDDKDDSIGSTLRVLGDYRLLREIGRGGMGVVYEAEQISLQRRVALKTLPLAGALDARCLQRFRNEAMAAAQLDHSHIVNVYGVGCERAVHFYAMRLIDGRTLADLIHDLRTVAGKIPMLDEDRRCSAGISSKAGQALEPSLDDSLDATLSSDLRVAAIDDHEQAAVDTAPLDQAGTIVSHTSNGWFQRVVRIGVCVAEGLHYAHDCGITHRDIKPSNLLVDSEGKVWITDFGLAQIETAPALTRTMDVIGTLRYMSPEQASGKQSVIDHRTDVYSLGVTLYELLTLETPFSGRDSATLLKQLAEVEPRPLRALNQAVPVDLETIVMKAIAKTPDERYASAQVFADDLQRFSEGRPILARKAGPVLKTRKWMRRHPAVIGLAVAVAVVLVVGLTVSNLLVANALGVAEVRRAEAEQQTNRADRHLYLAHMRLAKQDWQSGQIGRMRGLLDSHVPASGETDRRGWEWHYLNGLCQNSLATFAGHTDKVYALSVSPDGTRMATASADHRVIVWDVESQRKLLTLYGHESPVYSVAWSPKGDRIASGDQRGRILVWDVGTAKIIRQYMLPSHIYAVGWSPDANFLCAGNHAGTIRIWEAESGRQVRDLNARIGTRNMGMIRSLSWSRDGKRIAVGENHLGHVQIWDALAGRLEQSIDAHNHVVSDLAWSPDSSRLATISADQRMFVWSASDWTKQLSIEPAHDGEARALAWSSDGKALVSGGDDGIVKLWNAESGELLVERRGHFGPVHAVSWLAKTGQMFSASADGTAKLWSAEGQQDFVELGGRSRLAWDPDGSLLAIRPLLREETNESAEVATQRPCLRVMDPYAQRVLYELVNIDTSIWCIDWSNTGHIAAGASGGNVHVWDTNNNNLTVLQSIHEEQVRPENQVRTVAWSPDSRLLARTGADNNVVIWDVPAGQQVRTLTGHREWINSAAWSPDGKWLATVDFAQQVKVWELATGREKLNLRLHPFETDGASGQYSVAWSPDGRYLAAGSCEGVIVVWDATNGREVRVMRGHNANVRSVAWHPDGTRLASGSLDRTVRVWNVATGEELLTFSVGTPVHCVEWSPDGRSLASAGEDSARLWDATPSYLAHRTD